MFAFFGGALLIGKTVSMQRVTTPVFAGDAYGFSVRGGRKLEWASFKGAQVMPFGAAIVLEASGVGPRDRVEIKTLELSAQARDMAKAIEDYAALAKRNALMGGAVTLGVGRPGRAAVTPTTIEDATRVAGATPPAQPVPTPAPACRVPLNNRPLGNLRARGYGAASAPLETSPVVHSTQPVKPFMDRLAPTSGTGPISTTPRLSDRLFGRRKVI